MPVVAMVLLSIAVLWRYAVVARIMGECAPVRSSCALLCVGHLAMVVAVVMAVVASITIVLAMVIVLAMAMVMAMVMIIVLVLAMAWCRLWSWCCCMLCCRYCCVLCCRYCVLCCRCCVLCCALMRAAGDDAVLQGHRQCAGAPSEQHTDS